MFWLAQRVIFLIVYLFVFLKVHASAQWALGRESTSGELRPPLDLNSPLLAPLSPTRPRSLSPTHSLDHDDPEERWMAQVGPEGFSSHFCKP